MAVTHTGTADYKKVVNLIPAGTMITEKDIGRLLPNQYLGRGQGPGGRLYEVHGDPYKYREEQEGKELSQSAAITAASMTGAPAGEVTGKTTPAAGYGTEPKTQTETPTPTAPAAPAPAPTPSAGATQSRLQEAAARQIEEAGTLYNMDRPMPKVPTTLREPHRSIAIEAVKAYEAEKPVLAAQARKAQGALETVTEGQFEYQATLGEEMRRMGAARTTASKAFADTIGVAEKYSSMAYQRTVEGLQNIDDWGSEILNKLDFNRAHDMEVAVQSTVDGMNELERQTLQQYGADSDEYRQLQMSKGRTLANVLSTTQAAYGKMVAEVNTHIMNAKAEFQKESSMYQSFQEQQEVEIRAAMANADAAYAMEASSFMVQSEMMKLAGWEDLANWQIETPVFSMDASATLGFIGSLAMEQWNADMAYLAAKKAGSAAESAGRWGGIGSALGGVGGAIATALILSDEKVKENMDPITEACKKVCQVSGFTFNYTFRPDDRRAGIMAQDLEKVLPEAVVTAANGLKYIRLDAVAGLLMSSVKELTERVKALEEKLNA